MSANPLDFYGANAARNTQGNTAVINQNALADQQRNTLPHSLAIKGLQDKLSTIDQAKDPQAYSETVDQIQGHVHAMREIFHPDATLGAGDWLKTHTTDRLHITNHDARVKELAAKNAAGVTQDASAATALAQATPPDALQQYSGLFKRATGRDMTDDEKTQWAQRQGGIAPPAPASETERSVAQIQKEHPGMSYEDALKLHTEVTTKESQGGAAKLAAPLEQGGVLYGARGADGKEYLPDSKGNFPPGTPPEVVNIYGTIKKAQAEKEAAAEKKQQAADDRQIRGFAAIAGRMANSEQFQVQMADYRAGLQTYRALDKAARESEATIKFYEDAFSGTGNKSAADTALITDYTGVLAKGGRKTQAEIAFAQQIGGLGLRADKLLQKAQNGELPPQMRQLYVQFLKKRAQSERDEADAAKPDTPQVAGVRPQGPKAKALKSKQGGAKSLADRLNEALQ